MSALDIGRIVALVIQVGCYGFALIVFPIILRRNARKHRQELDERHEAWKRQMEANARRRLT